VYVIIYSLHDDQKIEVKLSVCYLNVQSLGIKAIPVADYVVSEGIDVLRLSKRGLWLTDPDQFTRYELVPAGYEFNHIRHKSGIGILYNSWLTVTVSKSRDNGDVYPSWKYRLYHKYIGKVTVKFSII